MLDRQRATDARIVSVISDDDELRGDLDTALGAVAVLRFSRWSTAASQVPKAVDGIVVDICRGVPMTVSSWRFAEVGLVAAVLVLIGTEDLTASVVNDCYRAGALLAVKPLLRRDIDLFGAAVIAVGDDRSWLRRRIATMSYRHRLTAAEVDTLDSIVCSRPIDELLARRGITANTYKSFVRSIREKLGAHSTDEIRRRVLDPDLRVL